MCLNRLLLLFLLLVPSVGLKAADTLDFESIYSSIRDFRIETTEIIEDAVIAGEIPLYQDPSCTEEISIDSLGNKFDAWFEQEYKPDFYAQLNIYSTKEFDLSGKMTSNFYSWGFGFQLITEIDVWHANSDLLFVKWFDISEFLDSSTFKVLNSFVLQALQIQDYSIHNKSGSERLDIYEVSRASMKFLQHNVHWNVTMDSALANYAIGVWTSVFTDFALKKSSDIEIISNNPDTYRIHLHRSYGLEPYLCSSSRMHLDTLSSETIFSSAFDGHFYLQYLDYFIINEDKLSGGIQKMDNTSMMSTSEQSFISLLRELELTTYKYIVNSNR